MHIFSVIRSVILDITYFFWPLNVRRKLIRSIILVAGLIAAFVFLSYETEPTSEIVAILPQVEVGTIASVSQNSGTSFIGTLRAVSEAQIQSEAGGRVTAVNVAAGDQVAAGRIIASIENASERASVLQAQGAYEAAQAAAAGGDISVSQAQSALSSAEVAAAGAVRSAYTTVSNGFFSTIDTLISNPNTSIPGVRISTSQTFFVLAERKAFSDILPLWQTEVSGTIEPSDIDDSLATAISYTARTIAIVDIFIDALQSRDGETLNGTPIATILANFNALRSSLNGTLSALESTVSSLQSARENLQKAQLGGTNTNLSAANAQVKQALGSLRAAQANLEKTILRSPISGTVDVLRIKTGDYISAFTPVAQVSSQGALEVSLFVGESDLTLFSVGNTVLVNNIATGTVVNIAPAIDPLTFKTEVKVAVPTSSLTPGSTVTVTLDSAPTNVSSQILVPITAIKFADKDGAMFVVENNTLRAIPVTLGAIVGSLVTITSGIDADTVFVLDVRGRSEGQEVAIKN